MKKVLVVFANNLFSFDFREEKRRLKRLERKRLQEEKKLAIKIAMEERKMLIAHRKLESMRLLEELFNRVKVKFSFVTEN